MSQPPPDPTETVTRSVARVTSVARSAGTNAAHRVADERAPFRQFHGAGYRAIYDLSDLDRSLYMQGTGQSGNVLSPHYRDFAEAWRDVAYIPMSMDREDVLEGALGTLVLRPRR